MKTRRRLSPGAKPISTCSAAQGSSPAPNWPDRAWWFMAAGLASEPLRPRTERRSPVAPFLVPQEEGLGGGVSHGVVREGREAVLTAVLRPRIRRARCRDYGAEAGVGHDVDPRERRLSVTVEDDRVLAAAIGKAARPIGEGEGGHLDLHAVRAGSRARGWRRQLPPGLPLGIRPVQLVRELAAIPAEDRPCHAGEQASLGLVHTVAAQQVHPPRPVLPRPPRPGVEERGELDAYVVEVAHWVLVQERDARAPDR